ncbi:MAG: type II secretion system protein [Candidatus Omnitrophica bacterium]|nr:type II secretion system protein [Candidatus Omnitrophota bacterium]
MKPPPEFSIESMASIRGFSLIEVMISVILVTITFTGIFATYTTSMVIQNEIDERAKALFMAQKRLEEVATRDYEELEVGYDFDIYEDEMKSELWLITAVETAPDEEIENEWTRFPNAEPGAAYKIITVQALWGNYDQEGGMESLNLSWIRVKRENTVEFYERASSQMPQN